MGSAEFQLEPLDFPVEDSTKEDRAALKRQVAERLAAHRSRRGLGSAAAPVPIGEPKRTKGRTNRIAAAVADKYAHSQTYREFLAAEAERAIEQANAAAKIAARNAEAVTVAQQQLLADLYQWDDDPREDGKIQIVETIEKSQPELYPEEFQEIQQAKVTAVGAGLTVRLYEDVGLRGPDLSAAPRKLGPLEYDQEEIFALDDEIAFRRTPVFEEAAGPPIPLTANLIEFPRQLVAARKSRPRIAEGPLREEADTLPAAAQLRIFEVEASQISITPETAASLPEWTSIRLDAPPVLEAAESSEAQPEAHYAKPLQTAPIGQRLMAAAVDSCILGATFITCVAGLSMTVQELPALPVSAVAAAAMFFVLFVLYQLLFFTFSEATPGMRYARIGLCTFSDENPTRSQMRRRMWAVLLAACPMGLGFLWACLDEDRLGWHDRISRMYQRGY
jgi:uncharacterized RDD family membrane protein YckC